MFVDIDAGSLILIIIVFIVVRGGFAIIKTRERKEQEKRPEQLQKQKEDVQKLKEMTGRSDEEIARRVYHLYKKRGII